MAALFVVSSIHAEKTTLTAIPQSCVPEALPCQFSFVLDNIPMRHTTRAMVALPVKVSGKGLSPCITLSAVGPDGTKQILSALTLKKFADKDWYNACFFTTSFFREYAGGTTISFYVEQVPGPCATAHLAQGHPAALVLVSEDQTLFSLKEALLPIWDSPRTVNETVAPVSVGGAPAEGRLLFPPQGKVLVRNYALDKTYQENSDYVVEGNVIRLPAGSSIPFLTEKQLYPESADALPGTKKCWKGGYVAFTEGSFWNDHQLAVSYDHNTGWEGPVPSSAPDRLPRTKNLLKNGQPLKVALLGDSISAGASASGTVGKPPYIPGWGELAMEGLRQKYGSKITLLNPSQGGMTSAWGMQVAPLFVAPEKPDLCMIAFGMNDGGALLPEQYLANTKAIIESVRKENPDAEFVLVASMLSNGAWRSLETMNGYLAALKSLESEKIAVADVWSMHAHILNTKRYCDISGNHVNHPNDFMVRVYAQVVDALLGAK
jgi:lysophospholipase L1-like esterase